MEINFMLAGIIAVVFFVIKFINLRFIKKEDEPIKPIAIDSILVFLSVIVGLLISEQFGIWISYEPKQHSRVVEFILHGFHG